MKHRYIFLALSFLILILNSSIAQNEVKVDFKTDAYDRHGVVWSAGLFKSWLKDKRVDFNKIGNQVTPVFSEQKKMGFTIQSHYMYKPNKWLGVGIHLGLGLDVNSYIEAPVVLFGPSISFGSSHQFILDFGWADAKRYIVPGSLRNQLENVILTEIPSLIQQTELNTALYLGISYRI